MDRDIENAKQCVIFLHNYLGADNLIRIITEAMQFIIIDSACGFDSINGWSPYLEPTEEIGQDDIDEMFDEHCADIFDDSRIDYIAVADEFTHILDKKGLEYEESHLVSLLLEWRRLQ